APFRVPTNTLTPATASSSPLMSDGIPACPGAAPRSRRVPGTRPHRGPAPNLRAHGDPEQGPDRTGQLAPAPGWIILNTNDPTPRIRTSRPCPGRPRTFPESTT